MGGFDFGGAIGGILGSVFGGNQDLSGAMDQQNMLTAQAMSKADAEAKKAETAAAEQEAMLATRESEAQAETDEREARMKKGRKDLLFGTESGVEEESPVLGG